MFNQKLDFLCSSNSQIQPTVWWLLIDEPGIQVQYAMIDRPKAEGPTNTFSNIHTAKQKRDSTAFTEEVYKHNEI